MNRTEKPAKKKVMRSPKPKTWEYSKAKQVKPVKMSSNNLPSVAEAISKETGWPQEWILTLPMGTIMGMANKHLG